MNAKYDTMIIGPISLDHNIDYEDNEYREVGGAVVQSGFAAARTGHNAAFFTKLNPKDADIKKVFAGSNGTVFWKESEQTTSIRNKYYTMDKETRDCTALSICDPFNIDEIPDEDTKMYHLAGLIYGDFSDEIIKELSLRGEKVAVDAQCLLRHAGPDGTMKFYDWKAKKTHLQYIDYFKTDAVEAEILTGETDRALAAKKLHGWGAKEIMITHNTEVLVFDGDRAYTYPIKARNLAGRSGRGDTCFSGYITERLEKSISDSLLFATALVSLKMEKVGPYRGTRRDVEAYIEDYYPEFIK